MFITSPAPRSPIWLLRVKYRCLQRFSIQIFSSPSAKEQRSSGARLIPLSLTWVTPVSSQKRRTPMRRYSLSTISTPKKARNSSSKAASARRETMWSELVNQKFKKIYFEAKYSLDEYEKKLSEWEGLIQKLLIRRR